MNEQGDRAEYVKTGIPLYEASIKCDWNAAKDILEKRPELVRYSITENGETALHVAVSAKVHLKKAEVFVKNLVKLMKKEDLALENENSNTALYLAVVAGNLETVKIMIEKNSNLLTIPGGGQMLPLNVAALFGNYDLVNYLYNKSNDLDGGSGWTDVNRGWVLERCVQNDIFDIALKIVQKYPKLGSGKVLAILAGKPNAFHGEQFTIKGGVFKLCKFLYSLLFSTNQPSDNKHREPGNESVNQKIEASSKKNSNVLWRTINSVLTFSGSKVKATENKRNALQLLRIIWKDIAIKPKNEIDDILRGPPDPIKQDKPAPGMVVQVMQLQKLILDHIYRVEAITKQQIDFSKLKKRISESIVNLHVAENIIKGAPDSINQDNQPNSGKADHQALKLQKLISEHIVNIHEEIQMINEMTAVTVDQKLKALKAVISDHIGKMKTESKKINRGPTEKTYSSQALSIAAKVGNTKFLVELIRQHPDLIWKTNDKNQTIFHIAVRYRHAGIYNLLYEIGAMKDMITVFQDPKRNNMLHLVGMSPKKQQFENVTGVAFQMQRELLWFEEVKKMVPPSYRERKNKDGLTPRELFTKEHQEMVTEGEKWVKKIAAQCIVVAALVATMVFTAAFTVPGGYDQQNGIPILHSKLSFQIFVVADAISLFLSTASILYMFLSVFTSHYGERDFLVSVPKKLMWGLTFLFLSITCMMIAFCTGFFLLYQKGGLLWIPIVISIFGLIPFTLYIMLQIPLTFNSTHLFKPKKRVLYHENPKV